MAAQLSTGPGRMPAWPGDRGGHIWPKDREAVAVDGSRIRYTVRGPEGAPWLALCAGFMCPDNFWESIAPPLMQRFRVIVFNYRGIGASSDPRPLGRRARNVGPEDYTVEKFAGDLGAVLDAESVDEVVLVGHSMGCQVALEVYRQLGSRRTRAVVLLTGPYASPLHTFYGSKLGATLFPPAYAAARFLPMPVLRIIPTLLRTPIAMPGARIVRALGPHTPDRGMDLYFQHFPNVNPLVVLKIAHGMHRYDASPWLHEIDVPVLAVMGGRDKFTPTAIGEVLREQVPDCELVVIPRGTHGTVLEFPDDVLTAVTDFYDRKVGGVRSRSRRTRAASRDGAARARAGSSRSSSA